MSSDRPAPAGRTESMQAVQVRRAPRYFRFIILGLLLGAVVTLGVTWMFPEQPDYTRLQVAGLAALFILPLGAALGAVIALVIDAATRRRARLVEMEHVRGRDDVTPASDASSDAGAAPTSAGASESAAAPRPSTDPRDPAA